MGFVGGLGAMRPRTILRALIAVSLGVGLAVLAVGCSRTESEPHATAARQGPVDLSASTTAEPVSVGTRACRKRERSTVSKLDWPLWKTAWRVESGRAERNNLSPRAFAHRADTLWEQLNAACPKPSKEALAFATEVRRNMDGSVDAHDLDAVLASYRDWATATGQQHLGEALLKGRAACRQLIPNVSASYAVWWEPTPRGKDYWVQMIVQNNTGKRLQGQLEGSLWVTDPLWVPDPLPGSGRHTMHQGSRAYQWWWGGSSTDYLVARPHGRSTTFVDGFGEPYKLHLGPEGTVFDVRPVMQFRGCSLPVHRDH